MEPQVSAWPNCVLISLFTSNLIVQRSSHDKNLDQKGGVPQKKRTNAFLPPNLSKNIAGFSARKKFCPQNFGSGIRFHDLRHTATTLMIAEGTDVNTVREICGHKSLKTTLDYVHLLGGAVKKVAKLFGISPRSNRPIEVAKERPKLVLLR